MEKTYNYMRIYNDIKEKILAGVYANGQQLPTEMVLQDQYGVSRITAKRAMELLGEEALVERFPGKGTFVRLPSVLPVAHNDAGAKRRVIGVMISVFSSTFGQSFLAGVAEEANRMGQCLMSGLCYSSPEEEKEIIQRQIASGVEGIIAIPVHSESLNAGILNCAMEGFPLVLADRYMEGIPLPYVGSDHAEGAFVATQYLFKEGHQNIGLISSLPTTTAIHERETGYLRAYAMTRYRVNPAYLVSDVMSSMPGHNSPENIRSDVEKMKKYFKENPEVTALICIDYGVMRICETAAKELGLQIPRDLSIVCFDAPQDGFAQYEYTHIRQPEREMGIRAVQMLLDVIEGKREPRQVLLPTELKIGASTAAPNEARVCQT